MLGHCSTSMTRHVYANERGLRAAQRVRGLPPLLGPRTPKNEEKKVDRPIAPSDTAPSEADMDHSNHILNVVGTPADAAESASQLIHRAASGRPTVFSQKTSLPVGEGGLGQIGVGGFEPPTLIGELIALAEAALSIARRLGRRSGPDAP